MAKIDQVVSLFTRIFVYGFTRLFGYVFSYPNFVRGQLFVGMRTLIDHFEVLNTRRHVIRKVLRRFKRK